LRNSAQHQWAERKIRLLTEVRTMLPSQDIQQEEVCERAGEAINPTHEALNEFMEIL
jgi:hypothetical protein